MSGGRYPTLAHNPLHKEPAKDDGQANCDKGIIECIVKGNRRDLRRRKGHGDVDGRLADGCGHVRRENSADVSLGRVEAGGILIGRGDLSGNTVVSPFNKVCPPDS